jgi:hypothetical protein
MDWLTQTRGDREVGRVRVGLEFCYPHHFFCGLSRVILIYGILTLSVLILGDLL